jgi:predicted SnoaL-like aldol condensation-catalyzing enzyme
MAKLTNLLLGAGAALVLVACGQAQNTAANQPPPPPVDQAAEAAKAQLAKQSANEMVVESFFKPGISMDDRLALLSPDYIQHNPAFVRFAEVNKVQNGRDAFKLMLDTLSRLRGGGFPFGPPPGAATHGPQPPQGNALFKVLADGDLVTVIHQRYAPDPQHKGMFYETYAFDTFRLQDGKIAEHWDDAAIPTMGPMARLMRTPVSKIKFPKATQPIY